ncbi:adenosine deaminase [Fusibacter sp. 3D3]|uniref:adenosine deaminase n=1 Tax=Fusibacter sp. 3D3 TaxID=1048380 RepID=UPI00085727CE|nr:adenosine deaminase [Fusibacter sp. 3D3]GAU75417.1 adenosine deaminase [Fusibacter sp. 3D3]
MKNTDSIKFEKALISQDLETIRTVPKSDLHNHFVLGGNRQFLKNKTGKLILPIKKTLGSMNEMHHWVSENLGEDYNTPDMRKLLVEATFVQAKEDGIKILEIGEDVWGLNEFFNNDIDELISTFKEANRRISPDTELRLQIGLSRHCSISYLEKVLEPFWGRSEFYSIDIYGDEFSQPIENFKNIYRKAKLNGLRLKAHVGEWGTASDVIQAVELLELDEVQHGISVVEDEYAIKMIKERNIRMNITPTSNVKLGRVGSIKEHPIRKMFDKGIDLTINSDDILIFDSEVSQEYLTLFREKVFSADELDVIRLNGLKNI